MINVIIFDLGGVVFTNGTEIAINDINKKYGIPRPKLQYLFYNEGLGKKYRTGEYEDDEYWNIVAKYLEINNEDAYELRKIWHESYRIRSPVLKTITSLRKRYTVYALSGATKARVEYWEEQYELKRYFDEFFYSFQLNCVKTEKKFSSVISEKLDMPPNECLVIDDWEHFLQMMSEHGFNVILFESVGKLHKDLFQILGEV